MGLEANFNLQFDSSTNSQGIKDTAVNIATGVSGALVSTLLSTGGVTENTNAGTDTGKIGADLANTTQKYNQQATNCATAINAIIEFAKTGELNLTTIQNYIENQIIQGITMLNDEGQKLNEEAQKIMDRNNEIMSEIEALNSGSLSEGIEWVEESSSDEIPSEDGNGEKGQTKTKKMVINPNNPNAEKIQELLDEYNGNLTLLVSTIQPRQTEVYDMAMQNVALGEQKQTEANSFANSFTNSLKAKGQEYYNQIVKNLTNTMFENTSSMTAHGAKSTSYATADTAAAAAKATKGGLSIIGGFFTAGLTAISGSKDMGDAALFTSAAATRTSNNVLSQTNKQIGQSLGEKFGNQFASAFTAQVNQKISGTISPLLDSILGKKLSSFVSPELTKMLQIKDDGSGQA